MNSERVSALMDGECTDSELRVLLGEIDQEPELMRQWSRMLLVRDALAFKPVSKSQFDADLFCAGVMAKVDALAESAPAPAASPKVVAFPQRAVLPRGGRNSGRKGRHMVGWAAAASVTLVVLAGTRSMVGEHAGTPVASAPAGISPGVSTVAVRENTNAAGGLRTAGMTAGARGGLIPVSARPYTVSGNEPVELRWSQLDPEAVRESNAYAIRVSRDQGFGGQFGDTGLSTRNVDYRTVSSESH